MSSSLSVSPGSDSEACLDLLDLEALELLDFLSCEAGFFGAWILGEKRIDNKSKMEGK